MPPSVAVASIGSADIAFGDFRLSPRTRSLTRGDSRIDVPPRYFDLLSLLVEKRGEIVTKDDLFDRIWKDEIVTEGAITQAIRFLRRILEDDAREPRFIRTVSKHGYEWIAEVTEAAVQTAAPAAASDAPPAVHAKEPRGEISEAFRYALSRFASASLASALAGGIAATIGGVALSIASRSAHPLRVTVALATLGVLVGGAGGLGVGFGLSFAEALVRESRWALLALAGGVSGGLLGAIVHVTFGLALEALLGRSLDLVGGGYEGVWIGVFAGFGYGLATRGRVLAAPRAGERLRVVAITAGSCAVGACVSSFFGAHYSAASVDLIASALHGSELSLTPIGAWLGERSFGVISRAALSAYEGLFFGAGLVYGLTRRPARDAREAPA